jgi:hypothetical protein
LIEVQSELLDVGVALLEVQLLLMFVGDDFIDFVVYFGVV